MNDCSRILKQHNLKVTPQRVAILEYVLNSFSHPTADTIYQGMVESYPSMSLATVYKTLDTLRNQGVIVELNLGEDSNRYDANKAPHAHFKCISCNAVIDICLNGVIEHIGEEVAREYGVSVLDQRMFLFGKCPKCLDEKSGELRRV